MAEIKHLAPFASSFWRRRTESRCGEESVMKKEQKQFLTQRRRMWCKKFSVMSKLRKKLLALDGDEVVINALSEQGMKDQAATAERVLREGSLFSGKDAITMRGGNNACHDNVQMLLDAGAIPRGWTGWALTNDGLWRFHSWGTRRTGRVIETTEERIKYYGVEIESARPETEKQSKSGTTLS
jgi:hypothetical protein